MTEHQRLAETRHGRAAWKLWGPYLSERQWGTVREDYSRDGNAWEYVSHDAARSRARLISEKHPELKPDVFSPDGHAGLYLVTLGGRMDRDEAARVRQKALRLGLPHDTYIQNYSQ